MTQRPSLQRRLTLRDLDIEVPSDIDSSDDEEDLNYRSHKSISSDSQHYSDVEEGTTKSAQERFIIGLSEMGIAPELKIDDKEEVNRRMSDLTLGEKSYVLDLGRQKVVREDTIKQEATEEAGEWYRKAIQEGMPESTELFGSIFGQLMDETKAKYIEKHANQDEWLNQALDDLAAKMSAEELEELYQKAPSAEDTAKEKLQKKIKKVKKLMKKMVKENEKDSKEYRVNERKLAGYKKELGGETTVKKKSKSLRNSRAGKEEGEEKSKSRRSRSVNPRSSRTSKRSSSAKSGDAKKEKKEKRRSRSVGAVKKDKGKARSTSTTALRDKVKARRKKAAEEEKAAGSEQ